MTLAERMVQYRARNNLSQRAFAQKCGVSLQTINSVENGLQNPSKMTEAKILMVIEEDQNNVQHQH